MAQFTIAAWKVHCSYSFALLFSGISCIPLASGKVTALVIKPPTSCAERAHSAVAL